MQSSTTSVVAMIAAIVSVIAAILTVSILMLGGNSGKNKSDILGMTAKQDPEAIFEILKDNKILLARIVQEGMYQEQRQSQVDEFTRTVINSQPANLDKSETVTWGDKQPAIELVIFSNFLCHHCQELFETIKSIEPYAPPMRIYVKHLPNQPAAEYLSSLYEAACARGGDPEKLHSLWHQLANHLNDEQALKEKLSEFGYSLEDLIATAKEDFIPKRVKEHAEQGRKLNISGTPTIFINGYGMSGALDKDMLLELMKIVREGK